MQSGYSTVRPAVPRARGTGGGGQLSISLIKKTSNANAKDNAKDRARDKAKDEGEDKGSNKRRDK
jgi:hypothetical protein